MEKSLKPALASLALVSICACPPPNDRLHSCLATSDCSVDHICHQGYCRAICSSGGDCVSTEVCRHGVCLPSASDAGRGDAGGGDGATADRHRLDVPSDRRDASNTADSSVGEDVPGVDRGTVDVHTDRDPADHTSLDVGPTTTYLSPVVTRGDNFMGRRESFNRYYTDPEWQPSEIIYVFEGASGDGTSLATPTSVISGLAQAGPGTLVYFLQGEYAGCVELDSGGTYDLPLVLYGERASDGSLGVNMACCSTGREDCFNFEAADFIAFDGFHLSGGKDGLRSVGAGRDATQHQVGTAILNCEIEQQSRSGIFMAQSDWAIIEGNRIHDVDQASDGFGLYLTNGGDWNLIRSNTIYDNGTSDIELAPDPTGCGVLDSIECHGLASDGLGRGVSDFFLIEANLLHAGTPRGANLYSLRHSLVRNNIFAHYIAMATYIGQEQETGIAALSASDNVILHNLWLGMGTLLTLDRQAATNTVVNNAFFGVRLVGMEYLAEPETVLIDVDSLGGVNLFRHNTLGTGSLLGLTSTAEDQVLTTFSDGWFNNLRWSPVFALDDYRPSSSAPFLDRGSLQQFCPMDIAGVARSAPVDNGPFEVQP